MLEIYVHSLSLNDAIPSDALIDAWVTAVYGAAPPVVDLAGRPTRPAGRQGVTLTGTDGNDHLVGGRGRDTLNGNAGNDTLDGGRGADLMAGGRGSDRYIINNRRDVVVEERHHGIDTVDTRVSITLPENVDNAVVVGRRGLAVTGNDIDNVITGGIGNDTLDGGRGGDSLAGGDGHDVHVIDSSRDSVVELAGGGVDTVFASISVSLAPHVEHLVLTGTRGLPANGNALANVMIGTSGDDRLKGYGGDDRLIGRDGNDTLDGGRGADTLIGGDGDDFYWVDNAADRVIELDAGGTDRVQSTTHHTLADQVEELELIGSAGLSGTGNGGANLIIGNAGANQLSGGDGNDTLIGSEGADSLTGGDGDDVFRYLETRSSYSSFTDRILDFEHGDRIDLSAIDANTGVAGNQAFRFDDDGSFSAGEIRQTVRNGNLLIEANTNHTATPDLAILLVGWTAPLSSEGFIV